MDSIFKEMQDKGLISIERNEKDGDKLLRELRLKNLRETVKRQNNLKDILKPLWMPKQVKVIIDRNIQN